MMEGVVYLVIGVLVAACWILFEHMHPGDADGFELLVAAVVALFWPGVVVFMALAFLAFAVAGSVRFLGRFLARIADPEDDE